MQRVTPPGARERGTDPDAVALAASEMLRYRETFAESGVRDEGGGEEGVRGGRSEGPRVGTRRRGGSSLGFDARRVDRDAPGVHRGGTRENTGMKK